MIVWKCSAVSHSRICDHTVFTHSHSHHKLLRQDVCLCTVVIASPSPTTTPHFIIVMALKTRLVRTQTLFAVRIDCVLQDHFRPLTSDHNANANEKQSCKTRRITTASHTRMRKKLRKKKWISFVSRILFFSSRQCGRSSHTIYEFRILECDKTFTW